MQFPYVHLVFKKKKLFFFDKQYFKKLILKKKKSFKKSFLFLERNPLNNLISINGK